MVRPMPRVKKVWKKPPGNTLYRRRFKIVGRSAIRKARLREQKRFNAYYNKQKRDYKSCEFIGTHYIHKNMRNWDEFVAERLLPYFSLTGAFACFKERHDSWICSLFGVKQEIVIVRLVIFEDLPLLDFRMPVALVCESGLKDGVATVQVMFNPKVDYSAYTAKVNHKLRVNLTSVLKQVKAYCEDYYTSEDAYRKAESVVIEYVNKLKGFNNGNPITGD